MNIKILGTRGEIEGKAPWHSKQAGVLVDETFLMDLGEKDHKRLLYTGDFAWMEKNIRTAFSEKRIRPSTPPQFLANFPLSRPA